MKINYNTTFNLLRIEYNLITLYRLFNISFKLCSNILFKILDLKNYNCDGNTFIKYL